MEMALPQSTETSKEEKTENNEWRVVGSRKKEKGRKNAKSN